MSEPPPLFCTIVAKNSLARARVLARGLREHHPESAFEVLVVDRPDDLFDPAREAFSTRFLDDVELPHPREMAFRYGVVEFCTAVKPFFLRRLLNEGHERVVFLDPEGQVLAPLTEALEALEPNGLVLTPHLLAPARGADWDDVLLAGSYNLGFVALREGAEVRRLLDGWAERCSTLGLTDPPRGLYVNQRFMDLAPGFVARTRVLRHPGYNVGRWNLEERRPTGPAEAPLVQGQPLIFIHWSGLDPARPDRLEGFGEGRPVNEEPLRTLMRRYARDLRECGHEGCALWTYSHGRLSDGGVISPALRALFRAQPPGRFLDPFDAAARDGFVAWARRTEPGSFRTTLDPGGERPRARWRRLADRAALSFPGVLGTSIARLADLLGRFARPAAGDAGALMTRVLSIFDTRPELRAAFPQAFVEAHDGPRFVATLAEARGNRGLSHAEVARLRALVAGRPGERVADLYRARPDLMEAFPRGLHPSGDGPFLAWLRHSGRLEYGISEDEVLWFARGRRQHVCLRLQALYRRRPEWQRAHPDAFTRYGRQAFLEFVRGAAPPWAAAGLATLDTLCLPEEGEISHEADATDPGRIARPALLVGWHDAPTGMGELARATRRALVAVSHPTATAEVRGAASAGPAKGPTGERAPIPILHLNASEAPTVPTRFPALRRERPLIAYCTWELGTAPVGWEKASGAFDEVWTLSTFSASALAPSCPAPVLVFPPCLKPPPPQRRGRSDFGLADDEFVVLFAFDLQSEMERKNPLGLVRAFRSAFRGSDKARLVLKVRSARERLPEMRRLTDATADLPVTLVESSLDWPAMSDLMRACDVYASLHRSEGFGLTLAEAMSLGRPVVATSYSGTLDFTSPWNSFPVPWTKAEVTQDAGPYRRGETWAEPDVEAAAALLRDVLAHREAAQAVAERGRADVESLLSPAVIGAAMAGRLQRLGSAPLVVGAVRAESADEGGRVESPHRVQEP